MKARAWGRAAFGCLLTARQYIASPKGGRDLRDWARAAALMLLTAAAGIGLLYGLGV